MKEFKITLEDYVKMQKLGFGWKIWLTEIISIVFGLTLVFITIMIMNKDLIKASFVIPVFLFATIVSLAFAPYRQKKRFKKFYNSHKLLHDTKYKVTFDDKNIEWKSDSGYAKLPWEIFNKYKYNKDIIMLYEALNLIRIIPMRAFENEKEKEKFFGILEKKLKN